MNLAQWFMLLLLVADVGGAIGFFIAKQPMAGFIYIAYATAQIGWFAVASGYK